MKNKLNEKKQQLSGNSLNAHMKYANTFYYKQKLNYKLKELDINFQFY